MNGVCIELKRSGWNSELTSRQVASVIEWASESQYLSCLCCTLGQDRNRPSEIDAVFATL